MLPLHIPAPDEAAMQLARRRQDQLTKPRGSLGALETVAVALAGLQGTERPHSRPAAALLFAADHPVTKHGVSAYPAEVTAAMVCNFVNGGAAASVLCRSLGVPLEVVDVGVDTPYDAPTSSEVRIVRAPRAGVAGDLRTEDAMDDAAFRAAWDAGRAAVDRLAPGTKLVVLGEMGIGNTTPAAAVAAALLPIDANSAVGSGTGVSPDGVRLKAQVVADALGRLGPDTTPLETLRKLGGRELTALAGAAARAGGPSTPHRSSGHVRLVPPRRTPAKEEQ